jgi:CRP/FNR family transcriptional regulator, cyclic AMP receptor protein
MAHRHANFPQGVIFLLVFATLRKEYQLFAGEGARATRASRTMLMCEMLPILQLNPQTARSPMGCNPEVLKKVPLFSLLDDDEAAVLAQQVELKTFAARQRIYKMGEPGGRAYVIVTGAVRLTTVDEDHQEVVVDEPSAGEFFGFASMLDQTPHQTNAEALEETVCVEVDRDDIAVLLQRKPHAGMDMLTVLGRQFHASQKLVRVRAMRNPNELIEEKATFGDRLADSVARFGGSWRFIILFAVVLSVYTTINSLLRGSAWDPYPFILLNLFLSMLAAIQAPVIMMSQNRQDTKDRLRGELDYDVNRRAESEIQGLSHKVNLLGEKLGDVEDLLRKRIS